MDAIGTIFRLLWELGVYLFVVLPDLLPIILALATPLALGALCGVMNERSGVVNIGIEGIMLMAAFFGYLIGFALHESIGSGPALAFGVVAAILVGALLGVLHAWLTVSVRADQIIAGTMMNIAAFGVTGYLNRLIITPSGRGGAGVIAPFHLPGAVAGIPTDVAFTSRSTRGGSGFRAASRTVLPACVPRSSTRLPARSRWRFQTTTRAASAFRRA